MHQLRLVVERVKVGLDAKESSWEPEEAVQPEPDNDFAPVMAWLQVRRAFLDILDDRVSVEVGSNRLV